MVPTIGHSGKGKPMESGKRPGIGRGYETRDEEAAYSKFAGQWNCSLWDHIGGGEMALYLSNSTAYRTAGVNYTGNYGLWVTTMCQCRFIHCNKCTLQYWMVTVGGVCGCVTMGPLRTFHAFCCEPKTALKNSLLTTSKKEHWVNSKEFE